MQDQTFTLTDRQRDSFNARVPLRQLKRTLLAHKWLVLLICLVTLGGTIAYMVLRYPEYRAQVLLVVEPNKDMGRDHFYDQWNLFRKENVSSEPELIATGAILSQTMDKLHLGYFDVYHPLTSQIGHWWKGSWIGKKYRSIKHVFFPPKPTKWDLTPEEELHIHALIDMKAGVAFDVVAQTNVGRLVVKAPSPQVADIANTIADTYLASRLKRQTEEGERAYRVLTEQVSKAQAEMLALETQIQEYKKRNAIYFEFQKEQGLLKQWSTVEMMLLEHRTNLTRSQETLNKVKQLLQSEHPLTVNQRVIQQNKVKQEAKTQLLAWRMALIDKAKKFQPDAPEITNLKSNIQNLERMISTAQDLTLGSESSAVNSVYDELRKQKATLQATISGLKAVIPGLVTQEMDYRSRFTLLPERQRVLADLVRRHAEAKGLHGVLLNKQIQAKVSRLAVLKAIPSMRVVEYATPPQKPAWPKPKYMVPGALLVGLLLGLMGAYAKESLDHRVRGHHLEQGRLGAPFYATLLVRAKDRLLVRAGDQPTPLPHRSAPSEDS